MTEPEGGRWGAGDSELGIVPYLASAAWVGDGFDLAGEWGVGAVLEVAAERLGIGADLAGECDMGIGFTLASDGMMRSGCPMAGHLSSSQSDLGISLGGGWSPRQSSIHRVIGFWNV